MPRQVSVDCARFVEWLRHELRDKSPDNVSDVIEQIYAERIVVNENGIQFLGHDFRPKIEIEIVKARDKEISETDSWRDPCEEID